MLSYNDLYVSISTHLGRFPPEFLYTRLSLYQHTAAIIMLSMSSNLVLANYTGARHTPIYIKVIHISVCQLLLIRYIISLIRSGAYIWSGGRWPTSVRPHIYMYCVWLRILFRFITAMQTQGVTIK